MQLNQPERNSGISVGGQELAAGGEEQRASARYGAVTAKHSAGCKLTAFLKVTCTGLELYGCSGPYRNCFRCRF